MEKYEKYKDSGIEWIGEIPEHWELLKIRHVIEGSKDGIKIGPFGSSLTGKVGSSELPCKVYGQWNIINSDFSAGSSYVSEETFNDLSAYEIIPNDVLISMMGTVGKCAVIPMGIQKGIMDSHVVKVRLDDKKINSRFFYYIYDKDNSAIVISNIQRVKKGSIMDGLNSSVIKNLYLCLPSLPEQQSIASYLDSKCSKIDHVIATQQKRVELLKELKQSIITRAVTRGVNPDAKMKDSGVEWIGEIPEHWEVMKTSMAFPIIGSGTTPSTDKDEYYSENGINWLQTGDLNDSIVLFTSKKVTKKAVEECRLKIYPSGSLVIAMYGATIGKVGVLGIDTSVNQACCVLCKSQDMHSTFAYFTFLACKQSLINKSVGGGQPNISQDIIRQHKLPIPPISEQQQIVTYIEQQTSRLDSSITKAIRQIELLKEYKQSLITEVVTGKRKVC